jgi:dipeptidase
MESIGHTYCGQIIKPSKSHPALLSCIWSGLGFPLTSPYLPFYMGVDELPRALERGDQPGDFAYVFDQLYRRVFSLSIEDGRPVFSVDVARLKMVTDGCRAFDGETYRQSVEVESRAAALAAQGRESEARKLLTDFLNARTNAALDAANICMGRLSK